MKKIGIVSYNIYGNFTNYGSALQSWALHQAVKKVRDYFPVLIDYCPDILKDKDPLNPFGNTWDKDDEFRRMCELSMPAIKINYKKFVEFYENKFYKTEKKYTSSNFQYVIADENIEGFICGSDTIFCMDEFGFDDGYYANYECMKGNSVSYAASFGDPTLSDDNCIKLDERLKNFNAFGLRENNMISYIESRSNVPVKRVLDPTLLLTSKEYDKIAYPDRLEEDKYILYYSRRYNPAMEKYVEKMAKEKGLKVVEISLRAINKEKGHRMFYEAGVEEFLSLVKHAEYVVTNSFHGMIFAVQYKRPFVVFSREQCSNKIDELTQLLGVEERVMVTGEEIIDKSLDYDIVYERIEEERNKSMEFLTKELNEYI